MKCYNFDLRVKRFTSIHVLKEKAMILIKAIALILIYLALYYLLGLITIKTIGDERAFCPIWIGMFVYAILFYLVALPMKLAQVSLKTVSLVWLVAVVLIVALAAIHLRSMLLDRTKKLFHTIFLHKWSMLLVFLVVALELFYAESRRWVGSPWDTAYYIGEVTTSLLDGEMGTVDAIMGTPLNSFYIFYLLETYSMHSAVACILTGIPPLVEFRTVMIAVMIIMFNVILWNIGKRLFDKDYWKSAVLLLIVFGIYLFSNSMYWPGAFFLSRTFEGKSILANIFIPSMFYCFISIYEDDQRNDWIYLFLTVTASYSYCMTSLIVVPVMLFGYYVSLMIKRRNWKHTKNIVICLIPCMIMSIVYFLITKGVIHINIY